MMKCSRLNPKSNVPFRGFHLVELKILFINIHKHVYFCSYVTLLLLRSFYVSQWIWTTLFLVQEIAARCISRAFISRVSRRYISIIMGLHYTYAFKCVECYTLCVKSLFPQEKCFLKKFCSQLFCEQVKKIVMKFDF